MTDLVSMLRVENLPRLVMQERMKEAAAEIERLESNLASLKLHGERSAAYLEGAISHIQAALAMLHDGKKK